jgi:hypothetical protein
MTPYHTHFQQLVTRATDQKPHLTDGQQLLLHCLASGVKASQNWAQSEEHAGVYLPE